MRSVFVHDPQGRRWNVSVRMLPWGVRWRGPRIRRKEHAEETADGVRERRWYDWVDVGDPLVALDEGLGGFAVVLLVLTAIVIGVLFVLPAFILLVELLIVATLVLGAVAVRVLFRRPWLVDAVSDDGQRLTWKVVGYARSREVTHEFANLLGKGVANPSLPDAMLVR